MQTLLPSPRPLAGSEPARSRRHIDSRHFFRWPLYEHHYFQAGSGLGRPPGVTSRNGTSISQLNPSVSKIERVFAKVVLSSLEPNPCRLGAITGGPPCSRQWKVNWLSMPSPLVSQVM